MELKDKFQILIAPLIRLRGYDIVFIKDESYLVQHGLINILQNQGSWPKFKRPTLKT